MRLNKTIREAIIRNWKSAKWDKRIETAYNKFIQAHRDYANKQNVQGVKVLKENPELHRLGFIRTSNTVNLNWSQVRNLKRTSKLFFKLDDSHTVKCEPFAQSHKAVLTIDLIESEVKKFYKVEDLFNSQLEDVTSIVYSCTSVEKLLELAPKFKAYIPKETTSRSHLPVPMDTIKRVEGVL
ncbi:MAG: hypothetical protein Unbinned8596contig1000_40 [Prokaryotic dsDNA virus sp.]|nr:MAG: hypothetical protein Unbinned8596contig1000_40 [Prokaryotic dsDNA virus sp.]